MVCFSSFGPEIYCGSILTVRMFSISRMNDADARDLNSKDDKKVNLAVAEFLHNLIFVFDLDARLLHTNCDELLQNYFIISSTEIYYTVKEKDRGKLYFSGSGNIFRSRAFFLS